MKFKGNLQLTIYFIDLNGWKQFFGRVKFFLKFSQSNSSLANVQYTLSSHILLVLRNLLSFLHLKNPTG